MYKKIKETAEWLQKRMPNAPKTAIVLGTGLGQLAERIERILSIPYSEIPNFPVSTVEGHAGELIFGRLGGVEVMAMEGRFHGVLASNGRIIPQFPSSTYSTIFGGGYGKCRVRAPCATSRTPPELSQLLPSR